MPGTIRFMRWREQDVRQEVELPGGDYSFKIDYLGAVPYLFVRREGF